MLGFSTVWNSTGLRRFLWTLHREEATGRKVKRYVWDMSGVAVSDIWRWAACGKEEGGEGQEKGSEGCPG